MNLKVENGQLKLFKKLLPGLLPIIVFILVDEFWSTEAGLVVALAFGVGQLIYVYFREWRFDRFVLFDTALLIALGGVSILLDNDIFFKLKPAFINLIFCAILGLSAFGSKNLILQYTRRYMGDTNIPREAENAMQHTVRMLFYLMLAYTILVVYSAFFMSKEAWAFISGAFLYILFGVIFAWQFFSSRRKSGGPGNEEWLPVVDEKGTITGKVTRRSAHKKKGILHPVVHLHIINSKGEIYLQKRPDHKLVQPGKWDTAVGGHITFGETIEQALARETAEELNITEIKPVLFAQYKWETEIESELVFSFRTLYNTIPRINKQEVDDGRFWNMKEIRLNLGKEVFTPNFEHEVPLLLTALDKSSLDPDPRNV